MFGLSSQERLVLLVIVLVLSLGTMARYCCKRFPVLEQWMSVMESDRLYPRVDLNRASIEELEKIPYIGEETAQVIVQRRQEHGPFSSLEELKDVNGIYKKNFNKFSVYLKISR